MKYIIQSLMLIFLISCSPKEKSQGNGIILGFKTSYLAELGSEKYFELEKEMNKGETTVKYIDDIIYISYYDELNSCGTFNGVATILGVDSLKLAAKLASNTACTSTSIYKVTFLIDNPKSSKKTFSINRQCCETENFIH